MNGAFLNTSVDEYTLNHPSL